MTIIDVLKKLESFDKAYFTTADLRKLFPSEKEGFTTFLKRLVDKGVLIRLARGVYMARGGDWELDRVANQLYYPSYLSFATVLGRGGILNQIPYSLTFATTRKSKKMILGGVEVIYSRLKPELYFGYEIREGVNIAEPEKALLDQIYLVSLGKAHLDFEELNLAGLDKKKFLSYAARFPRRIKKGLREIEKRWGMTSVTVK